VICTLVPLLQSAVQTGPPTCRSDNSDWWSQLRVADEEVIPIAGEEPAASNFEILGINLGGDVFNEAWAKLGKAQRVDRGDASSGRSQICYVSVQGRPKIRLVFERGEVTDFFYLFADGPDWNGSDLCVKSNLLTENLSVASGLRLGQSPDQVRAILGKPSVESRQRIIYSIQIEKETPASDFAKLHRQHPDLSEGELRRNYASYTLSVYIEARFAQSKLNYLAISKSETH
jgi:hypothetical protein